MSGPSSTAWEGLGCPIRMDPIDYSDIDPTLDACCRRDEEDQRRASAKKRVLQQHDRVAAYERSRRHVIQVSDSFVGCRCCYDPNSDGGGDYQTLLELRRRRQQQQSSPEDPLLEEDEKKKQSLEDGSDDDSDDELNEMLNGFDDNKDETTKAWEEQRRLELQELVWHHQRAIEHGYGVHRPMHPTRILRAAGLSSSSSSSSSSLFPPPAASVVHLVDPESIASASLDLYLEQIAASPIAKGTKFMRSGGRSTLLMDSELAEKVLRLQIESDLPAVVAIRDGKVVATCVRLQGLIDPYSNPPSIIPHQVDEWLDKAGVLRETPPPLDELCRIRPEQEALLDHMAMNRTGTTTNKPGATGPEDCYYDCGLPSCQKTYPHQHVGIETGVQSGLFLPSSQQESSTPLRGGTDENPLPTEPLSL